MKFQQKNLVLSDSYLIKTFFSLFLKVVVIFESKNWIGLYLKVPPKIGVYYVIFPKINSINTKIKILIYGCHS